MERISGNITLLSSWLEEITALRPGNIVGARVLEVAGKEALLQLAGTRARVSSHIPLAAGERLQLLVQGLDGKGNLVLQVMAATGGDKAIPGLEKLLARLGVEANHRNLLLAAQLVGRGHPVSAQVLKLLAGAGGEAQVAPGEAAALVWLWEQGLPLKPVLVEALAALFGGAAQELTLEELVLHGEGSDLDKVLGQLLFSPRGGGSQLEQMPRVLGLNYEHRLQVLLNPPDSSPGVVEDGGLKSLLLALTRGKAEGKGPGGQPQALLDTLTGLQLLHMGNQGWLLHLLGWLPFVPRERPFLLSLGDGGDQGKGEKAAKEAILYTVPPRLGPTLVELRLWDDWLACTITVERDAARDLVENWRGHLFALMEDLPWRVQLLPCRVAKDPSVQQVWLEGITTAREGPQVDFRI